MKHHHISGYHPEMSVDYYVIKYIRDIFDEHDLYESYSVYRTINTVLKILPKKYNTSIRNRIIAAAAIWRVFRSFNMYPKEGIPYLTQLQICKIAGISDVSLRRASHYIEDSYNNG